MARPRKDKSDRRTGQIVVYVKEPIKDVLQAEAESRGMSVSTLAGEILESCISGAKNTEQYIAVPQDVVKAVVRQIMQEGFVISDICNAKLENSAQHDNTMSDHDKVLYPGTISSANLATQKLAGDTFAPKTAEALRQSAGSSTKRSSIPTTRRRKAVNRTMERGGDGNDS